MSDFFERPNEECSISFPCKKTNPHLDMIAIGPTLIDVHTPDEKCNLEDVRVTTELVIAILEKIAGQG